MSGDMDIHLVHDSMWQLLTTNVYQDHFSFSNKQVVLHIGVQQVFQEMRAQVIDGALWLINAI